MKDLHPHQSAALDMLRRSLMAGKKRPMVQAPTGFGKTLLASKIVEGALRKGKRVLFAVPAVSLVDQTVRALAEEGIGCVGVIQANHPLTDPEQPIQVASIQTLARRGAPPSDIVVIDEAHRWFDFVGEWMRETDWLRIPFVGLSATPWTRGLGRHYDDLLIAATTKDLLAKGFLAKFRVFAPSHPDLANVRTVAGDYHEGDLSKAMDRPELVADVVSTWLQKAERRPTLCFAVDLAHARKLTEEFRSKGVPTAYIDSNTSRDDRDEIGRRLTAGIVRVVVNVGTLTTGIDWDVRCIVLARPTKSEMLFVQIIGRGLRLAEGKEECLVLDHSDSTLSLGFPDEIHHTELDATDTGKKPKSRSGKQRPRPVECSKCTRLMPVSFEECPACGHANERFSVRCDAEGSLVLMQRSGRPKAGEKQRFYSALIGIEEARSYKPGWAAAQYRTRFGTWPKGLSAVSIKPDPMTLQWVRDQQAAWRSQNSAHAG